MSPGERPPAGTQPPGLRPPVARVPAAADRAGRKGVVWLALALVVALGLGVLLVLPKLVSGTGGGQGDASIQQAPGDPLTKVAADAPGARAAAEQALQDFLRARARLELANAPGWGEPEWSRAVAGADRGNELFSQRQFSAAADAFAESLRLLLSLESASGQRLAAALDSGWQALQQNDSAAALQYFAIAMAIDPGGQDALDGSERARVRPDLLRLVTQADAARSAGDLPAAQAIYLQAIDLDNAYEPAREALAAVSAELNEIAFREAMSRALSALQQEQTGAAEAALKQAASLKPDAPEVRNTRQELARTQQKLWLEGQRQSLAADLAKEDWAAASATYRDVLQRLPGAAFASQGLAVAADRERLHQQLDHYLENPSRLYAEEPRANAEELLRSAADPPAAEVRLAEKVRRLQALIAEATTPRTVTLQSDGLTNVQIYRVGRLGQFISQQLELLPGTYTVVGSRPGYRDVRRTLTVTPGGGQAALDIRCEEPV